MEWNLRDEIADLIDHSGIVYDADLKRAEIVKVADSIMGLIERCSADEPANNRREQG